MANDAQPTDQLASWKEIADYLSVNIRTAQKWEAQRGLPVRRLSGERGRVVASTAELDRWKKATLTTAPRWWSSLKFFRYYSAAATIGLAVAAGWTLADYLAWHRAGPPALFHAEYRTLTALDARGIQLWQKNFDAPFATNVYVGDEGQQRVWMGDLDGDGRTEVLFAYYPSQVESVGAALFCFAENGREKWRFAARAVTDRSQTHTPNYVISGFELVDLGIGRGREIAVTSRHAGRYPNHFALLDARGVPRAEYWHSGHLDYMNFSDLDGDGAKEILLAGVNNARRAATLIVLDPRDPGGTSAEGEGSAYQLLGSPAHERARLLFARSCINRKLDLYNMARLINIAGPEIRVKVHERMNDDSQFLQYTFNRRLEVLRVEPADGFRTLHARLEAEGVLDHALSDRELRELAAGIVRVR